MTGTRSVPAIICFFALAFAWTWGLLGLSAISTYAKTPLVVSAVFGPSIAAVAVTMIFGNRSDLRRWVKRCLHWRVGRRWLALALFAPPFVMLAALGFTSALGGHIPVSPVAGHFLVAIAQFPLVMALNGPLGEEFGWRGYALPTLTERFGWRPASLVVGTAWALWHVPLFWLPGSAQAGLPMALFLASTVALSVIFARLAVRTQFSVIPAILFHSAINWWSMVLPVMPKNGNSQIYSLVMTIVIAAAFAALLGPGRQAVRPADPPCRSVRPATHHRGGQ